MPAALMERMRASPCIALQVARADRVKLLIEDYQHFACNAPALTATGYGAGSGVGISRV